MTLSECYPEVIWAKNPQVGIEDVLKSAPLHELYSDEINQIAEHFGTDTQTVTQMFGHIMRELYPPKPTIPETKYRDYGPT